MDYLEQKVQQRIYKCKNLPLYTQTKTHMFIYKYAASMDEGILIYCMSG